MYKKYYTKLKRSIKNNLLNKQSYQFLVKDWFEIKDLQLASQVLNTQRFSISMQPILHEAIENKRIMVIAPHPDDEMLGAGGTLIKSIQKGSLVATLYLTSGKDFSSDILKVESRAVAERIGYETYFLDYRSGSLPIDDICIERFSKIIDDFAPDILFIPFCLDDHDDHRRASHILWLAHKRKFLKSRFNVWAYQVYTAILPSVVVDITDVVDEKASAIRLWRSQMEERDWVQFSLGLNAHNIRYLPYNKPNRYAETFFVLPLKAYLEVCSIYFSGNSNQCYYNSEYLTE